MIKLFIFRVKAIFWIIATMIIGVSKTFAVLWLCMRCLRNNNVIAYKQYFLLLILQNTRAIKHYEIHNLKYLSLSKWFARSCHSETGSCAHRWRNYFLIPSITFLTTFCDRIILLSFVWDNLTNSIPFLQSPSTDIWKLLRLQSE